MKVFKKQLALLLAVIIMLLSMPLTVFAEDSLPDVKKVDFETISIIEGTGGYKVSDYNYETGNYDLEYYRYSYTPEFTVTLKDGTVLKSEWRSVTYNDKGYRLNYSDGQSYENQWGVGTHTVTASIMNFDTSFEVEITESPYRSLEILEVQPVKENENCYVNNNGDTIYFLPQVIFQVTDKDGTSFISSSINNRYVSFSDNQQNEPWTVGGDNRFTISYINLSAEASVELQESSPFEYIEQNGGLYFTGYKKLGQKSLEIPSEIDGKPVIGVLSLGKYDAAKSLTSVTIPDSVTTIGDSTFAYARNLETLTVGSSVNYLNAEMFSDCNSLNSISVSENNPDYCDENGIVYNKQMTDLVVYPLAKGEVYTVPASVNNIDILNKSMYDFLNVTFAEGSKTFVTVDGITYNADKTKVIACDKTKSGEYVMPDTVTEIADNAFRGCSDITGIKVSESVTSIVYCAFADCSSLAEITLPSKLISIDERAFANCSQLKEVSLPSSLKTIGKGAFTSSGLESISLPNSVTSIERDAFEYCSNLASITIPSSVTSIGDYAFLGCTSLEGVYITDLAAWCNIIFSSFYSNPLCFAKKLYINGELATDIVIPEGVTRIEKYTFYNCTSLASVTIPEGVEYLGSSAFAYCTSLTEISIPDSVTEMGKGVFSSCARLQSLTIGKGLEAIPSGAFWRCALKKITIPENIKIIGSSAFYCCESLTDVEFTNNDIEIGAFAFYGCPLKELNLPDGIKDAGGSDAFAGTDISNLSLPNSVTKIAYRNFADCSQLSEIDIPSSVISMGGHAFDSTAWYDAHANGEVYLEHVFYGFKGTMPANTEISIKEGTKLIADYALENRTGLSKLTLPEGLEKIGSWAFYKCSSMGEINIPSSVTVIDTSAFAGCSSLSAINVSENNPNYKSIDGVLFSKDETELLWCPKRESATYEVPVSVTKIATGAFSDSGVTAVKILNPDTELCEHSIGFRSLGVRGTSFYFTGWEGGCFEDNGTVIICPENSKAYAYAIENSVPVMISNDIVIQTENKDVSIKGNTEIIAQETVINLVIIPIEEITLTDTGIDKYNLESAVVFNITLENNGVKVQPNGMLTVSIAVPETLDGNKCCVLYVDDNGNITDMKASYENGRMIFETDHFSNYMIVETDGIAGDVNGDGVITLKDILIARKYVAGVASLTEKEISRGDLNSDGLITLKDILIMRKIVAGVR